VADGGHDLYLVGHNRSVDGGEGAVVDCAWQGHVPQVLQPEGFLDALRQVRAGQRDHLVKLVAALEKLAVLDTPQRRVGVVWSVAPRDRAR